jgi:copper chaperone CopZ
LKKVVLHIENMHCSNCAMILEGIEDELAGIKEISASYRKQQLVVRFDEKIIKIEDIVHAVEKKGYVVRMETIVD